MCGIVGILGRKPVADDILAALTRLEYRGYDGSGLATLEQGGLTRTCSEGKLVNLRAKLEARVLLGKSGVGHTRWATHGKPTEVNAHPHATDKLAVVHNGIIENFKELQGELEKSGVVFSSTTDTEVVAHLVTNLLRVGLSPLEAVQSVLKRLRGSYALAFLFAGEEDLLIGARKSSPLAVGYGNGEMYLGSDALALGPMTDTLAYLEDYDVVEVRRSGAVFYDSKGAVVDRPKIKIDAKQLAAAKEGFRHYMEKEIHEQPDVVGDTLRRYLNFDSLTVQLPQFLGLDFSLVKRIIVVACGTSYYAGLVARYWLEQIAGIPTVAEIASDYRYRTAPVQDGDLVVLISQSGETADTAVCMEKAKERGQRTLGVVNVLTSTIARESDAVFQTLAGPEIGVASTKAFTCQLAVLACLALYLGKVRGLLSPEEERRMVKELLTVPRLMEKALGLEKKLEVLARKLALHRDVLYMGRGTSQALALEGALKLKEISYIHAEGYGAGELKHGPIALVEGQTPTVAIAPYDDVLFEKTASNMQEVDARSGPVILFTDAKGKKEVGFKTLATLILPATGFLTAPMVYAVPLQLLAYHVARVRGTDIDQPRNLAKSVTVE